MKATTGHEIVNQNKEFTFFSWSIQGTVNPIPVTKAEGVYFWDVDGKRYIDFSSMLMNANIGHQHPKVVKAIQDQASQLCFVQPAMATAPRGELGELLSKVTPGNLKKTFFCLGGAEANENAIKIARMFTGKFKILARYRSYHGATYGAIALTGDYRRPPVEPAMPGVIHFLDPYCYRCPFGWTRETCHRECIKHVEEIIQYEGPNYIAAIIMEGVTGSNGIIIPPEDYWPRLREICDKYGILLIADEVMSGWGRTGKWFAVDNWGVIPDIITTAKGITSGYVPLGAVIVSDKITKFFDDKYLFAGLTYSGHALACAAAIATIKVYEEEGLIENAVNLGKSLGQYLEDLKVKHPSIGDVRYIGLFSAIELVKDRKNKEMMGSESMIEIGKFLRAHGLSTFIFHNMVLIAPPLCIDKEQLNEGLDIIDQALELSDLSVVKD